MPHSSGVLGIKVCNYLDCIGHYINSIFDDMTDLLKSCPEDKRVKAMQLHVDALAVGKQKIASAKHALEAASETLATSIAL